ncbi:MAG: AAA family ATPase [Phycisphaerales bacterium]|nr:AAA family ATPase [Phycisphaerales bacterium]
MIEQLTIENFACFKHVDVPLKPLTVLIGPNNTGKSCFLRAIKRLLTSSTSNLALADRWGSSLAVEVILNGRIDGKRVVLDSRGPLFERPVPAGEFGQAIKFSLPINGIPAQSQGVPDSATAAPPVGGDGSNIPTIFDYYLRRDKRRLAACIEEMKRRVDGLVDIHIGTPTPSDRRIEFRLENDLFLPTNQISVGVQYLLFFVALAHHPNTPRFILIEEPENGLHPKRLKDVVGLLRSLTKGEFGAPPSQVILTTHSPYLLDFINLDEDEVLVFSRNDDGSRTVQPVDRERLKHFTKEFLLGEIWYNESEEGLIKQSP